jgi:hypothetical protein
MAPGEIICMAILIKFTKTDIANQGCCGFDIFNSSTTTTISILYKLCPSEGAEMEITIPPLTTFSEEYFERTDTQACLSCVIVANGPWEYQPCPFT